MVTTPKILVPMAGARPIAGGRMKVSVVVPHYNMSKYLRRAIGSVRAQGDLVHELIVVDDGSDYDEWCAAFKSCTGFHFRTESWFRHEINRGQAHAANLGIREALHSMCHGSSDALAFLDADDEWMPDKLAHQVAALEKDPELDIVFGHALQIDQREPETTGSRPRPAPLLSSMLIRAGAMEAVGFLREDLGAGTMLEWLDRARNLKTETLKEVVYMRYVHGTNYGIVHAERAKDEYAQALLLIERRRRGEAY